MLEIRHLCDRKGDNHVEVNFFALPPVIAEVLSPLDKVQESLTFQDLWVQYGKKAQRARENDEPHKRDLSISNVVETVWKPAYKVWNQLVASVMDGSLALGDVDKFFEKYKNQKDDLLRELVFILHLSQSQTSNNISELKGIVEGRVAQIQQYQKLHQYGVAADTIWEFKEEMGFSGDFTVIEDLRNQVSILVREGLRTTNVDDKPGAG